MFKLLFILFAIKELLGNATSDINIIQPGKVLSDKGKLSGGNSDGNIAYLKNNNVHIYLFLQAKENRIL